ncbi:hypothetical protein [Halodesulfovibrio sp.]|jgi:hypothetical protein|uniref:hypothetical protein n=1 Tax=Halodesulfovibrio sp. TaxID=1912772 RepID=UPI0025FD4CA2|nr:hypothetical protein [Halodesulfovibrio sp.]MCT4534952.1 hypothetical protein [Halodesulfovibrio sp.]MCT4627735.1 hypothetical protein [Halodesulfovibrio sp.]
MPKHWKDAFRKCGLPWKDTFSFSEPISIKTLPELKEFLDAVQITQCLLRPFFENDDYPLVERGELLPSFESDFFEYKDLPGFSLVAFERELQYFSEIFQFDILHSLMDVTFKADGYACPLENCTIAQNVETIQNRIPRKMHDSFKHEFGKVDTSVLDYYPQLLPYILEMDRAHVLALDSSGYYHLAGVYGSFPSDLDPEIKRFGLRAKKFEVGNHQKYEHNRLFVYQYLMELYGFTICSERRTSSALFSRRLHKAGEKFMVRVLGQTDRVITTISSATKKRNYPTVEKIALVQVDEDQSEVIRQLEEGGFFVDRKRHVVILRVTYTQHKFNPDNVRQERALSVAKQEVIHPITGRSIDDLNIIKDTTNMILRLNDIVRGEYIGHITYKRSELVENTDTEEKRLKFLYSWLTKHQRRIISYSDEFYANVIKVLDGYLLDPDNEEAFDKYKDLYQEVQLRYNYIQQARKVMILERLKKRKIKGEKIPYAEMVQQVVKILQELKFDIAIYFEELVASMVNTTELILNDRYLCRKYIMKKDDELSEYGLGIKKEYGKIVSLLDDIKAIRKSRKKSIMGFRP